MFWKILAICLWSVMLHGSELSFICRSDLYKWLASDNNASEITVLTIQDGWSSRQSDFINGEHFEDQDIALIAQEFNHLKFLKLNLNVKLTDAAIKYLEHLSNLQELYFRKMERLTDAGLFNLAQAAPNLEVLSFEGPFKVLRGESFEVLLDHLPCLKVLRMIEGTQGIPKGVIASALRDTEIEELVFGNNQPVGYGEECEKIWGETFAAMPQLHHLMLARMDEKLCHTLLEGLKKGKPAIEKITLLGSSLSQKQQPFPIGLKSLCLQGYIFFKDHAQALGELILKAQELPELEVLEIYPHTYFKEPLLQLQSSLQEGFPSLQELHLFQSDAYPHVKHIAITIKQQKPQLKVFVDGVEISP